MLTPEQIQSYRQKYSINPMNAPTPVTTGMVEPKEPQNVFGQETSSPKQFAGGFVRGAGEAFKEGAEKVKSDFLKYGTEAARVPTWSGEEGKITQLARGGLRQVGNVLETAFTAPIQGITEGISDIKGIQEYVSRPEVSAVLDKVNEGLSNTAETSGLETY